MPRIASLHSINHPSSNSYGNRRRRIDRNSYIHSPANPRSRPTLRLPRRPQTLFHTHHQSTRPSFFTRHNHSTKQSSTSFWKSRFSFRSRKSHQPVQPLTLEEKLRIAANRVRKFERQTDPSTSPRFSSQTRHRPKTKSKRHTRTHAGVLPESRTHSRKRDRFQRRLKTFTSGKL
jgi:hypothetical protein